MLLYYLFWMFMGFIKHFYTIIFGTNLLTQSPVPVSVFSLVSVFRRKGISNGVQTGWNLSESCFWNKRNPRDLEWTSRKPWGGHEGRGRPPRARRLPRGPLEAPPTYFFHLYIPIYPENIKDRAKTIFPLPQPSVPVRSHLGTFSGDLPEGDSIMEGFYINTIASPTMCE